MLRSSLSLAILALALTPLAARADTLIVKQDPGLSRAERAQLREEAGVRLKRRLSAPGLELVSVPHGQADRARAALAASDDVEYARPDTRVYLAEAPLRVAADDPYFKYQYSLLNVGQNIMSTFTGVPGADMRVPYAWNLLPNPRPVVIAVIDTGIDHQQPDLAASFAFNTQEIPGNGRDDDDNGYIDDTDGWDFADEDNKPQTEAQAHGTHVAGIIAAQRNNAAGVAGVMPSARLLDLRIFDETNSASWSQIVAAFDYAGQMGVPIVNASLSGPSNGGGLTEVIESHPNTLYVVAAGNGSSNLDASYEDYPCELPAKNLICVGASTFADTVADFSNYSATSVDVFAPGLDIVSTFPNGEYRMMSGTSMATPNVAGVAALAYAARPKWSANRLKALLLRNTDQSAALAGKAVAGRLNAQRVMSELVPDRDGDGLPDTRDRCPTVFSTLTDGCLADDGAGAEGQQAPQLSRLRVRRRGKHWQAMVVSDGIGRARWHLERQSCWQGSCEWLASKRGRAPVAAGQTTTVSLGRLRRGRYALRAFGQVGDLRSITVRASFRVR